MPLSLGPSSTRGSAWLESVLLPPAAEDAHAAATEAGEDDLPSFSQQDIGPPAALTTAAVERHGRASSSQTGAAAAQSTTRLRWTFAADVASTHVPLTVRYGAAELFPAHKRFDIDDEERQQAEGATNADAVDEEAPGGAHAGVTAALAESSAAAGTRNPDQWTVAGIAAQVESWRSSGSRRSKGKGKGKEKAEDEEEDDDSAPFHSVPLHLIYEELIQEAGVADEGLAPAIRAAAMIETGGGGAGGKDGAQAPKIPAARDQAHPLSRKRLLVYEDAGVGPTLTVAFVGGDTDHLIFVFSIQLKSSKAAAQEDEDGDEGGSGEELWSSQASAIPAGHFSFPVLEIVQAPFEPEYSASMRGQRSYPNPWMAVRTREATTICSLLPSKVRDVSSGRLPPYTLKMISDVDDAIRRAAAEAATLKASVKEEEQRRGLAAQWLGQVAQVNSLAFAPRDRSTALCVDRKGNLVRWSIKIRAGGVWQEPTLSFIGRVFPDGRARTKAQLAARQAQMAQRDDDEDEQMPFAPLVEPSSEMDWRIVPGPLPNTLLIYCSQCVFFCALGGSLFADADDIDGPSSAHLTLVYRSTLHPRIAAHASILSVCAEDHHTNPSHPLIYVATLAEVICFDGRRFQRDAVDANLAGRARADPASTSIAWVHGRGPDPSLVLTRVPSATGNGSLVVLSSAYNRLQTVYSARASKYAVHSPCEPSHLPSGLEPQSNLACPPACALISTVAEDWAESKTGCSHAHFEVALNGKLVVSGIQERGAASRHSSSPHDSIPLQQAGLPLFPVKQHARGAQLLEIWRKRALGPKPGYGPDTWREHELYDLSAVYDAALAGTLGETMLPRMPTRVHKFSQLARKIEEEDATASHLQLQYEALQEQVSPGPSLMAYPNAPAAHLALFKDMQDSMSSALTTLEGDASTFALDSIFAETLGIPSMDEEAMWKLYGGQQIGKKAKRLQRNAIDQLHSDLQLSSSVFTERPLQTGVDPEEGMGEESDLPMLDDSRLIMRTKAEAQQAIADAETKPDFSWLSPMRSIGTRNGDADADWVDEPDAAAGEKEQGSSRKKATRPPIRLDNIALGRGAKLVLSDWTLGQPIEASLYAGRLGRGRAGLRSTSVVSRSSSVGSYSSFGTTTTALPRASAMGATVGGRDSRSVSVGLGGFPASRLGPSSRGTSASSPRSTPRLDSVPRTGAGSSAVPQRPSAMSQPPFFPLGFGRGDDDSQAPHSDFGPPDAAGSSQMPDTVAQAMSQALPGPHGAAPTKKKQMNKKRRIGGF